MSDVDYFEGYIGQAVQIQNTSYPETWVVTEKVHETLSEHDRYEYEELNCISGAYGTFICTNTNDPSQVIMRVYLQIPHTGSAYQSPKNRAQKATFKVPRYVKTELDGLKKLTAKECKSASTLISYRVEQQDYDGFVPGGFKVTLFVKKLPGVQLDAVYWKSSPKVRSKIREAFKAAWQDCVAAGIGSNAMNIETLSWDAKDEKV